MSLKAKLEAVTYAAEEPVTLAQLAALFATDALDWKAEREAASALDSLESTCLLYTSSTVAHPGSACSYLYRCQLLSRFERWPKGHGPDHACLLYTSRCV